MSQVENYLQNKKNSLMDRKMILNSLIKKNRLEIEDIEKNIQVARDEIDETVDVFSPHGKINNYARNNLVELNQKTELLKTETDKYETELLEIIKELSEVESIITEVSEMIEELHPINESENDNSDSDLNSDKENYGNSFNVSRETLNGTLNETELSPGRKIIEVEELIKQKIAMDLSYEVMNYLEKCVNKVDISEKFINSDPIRVKMELGIIARELEHSREKLLDNYEKLSPLNEKHDNLNDAIKYIIDGKTKQGLSIKVEKDTTFDEIMETLPSVDKLSVLRVLEASVDNSIRHGKSSEVNVKFLYDKSNVKMIIEDNGQGFDVDTVEDGNGFKLMKSRTTLLEGTFTVKSSHNGTYVEFSFPMNEV